MYTMMNRLAWWRYGLGVTHAIERLQIRLPVWTPLRIDSGQVVHTFVLLSESSVIWCRCKLRRVTAGYGRGVVYRPQNWLKTTQTEISNVSVCCTVAKTF